MQEAVADTDVFDGQIEDLLNGICLLALYLRFRKVRVAIFVYQDVDLGVNDGERTDIELTLDQRKDLNTDLQRLHSNQRILACGLSAMQNKGLHLSRQRLPIKVVRANLD